MSHGSQRIFYELVKKELPEYFNCVDILEVGSLDINGTVRDFFTPTTYTGVDVGPGNGVDIVCEGQNLTLPDNTFDHTTSAECFEHNPYWKETFLNMVRMTSCGGLITFTCASEGRPVHGTSNSDVGSSPLTVDIGWEYYRNLGENDFINEIDDFPSLFSNYAFYDNRINLDLYFVGIISPSKTNYDEQFNAITTSMVQWLGEDLL